VTDLPNDYATGSFAGVLLSIQASLGKFAGVNREDHLLQQGYISHTCLCKCCL